jgi:hypothetical protein
MMERDDFHSVDMILVVVMEMGGVNITDHNFQDPGCPLLLIGKIYIIYIFSDDFSSCGEWDISTILHGSIPSHTKTLKDAFRH